MTQWMRKISLSILEIEPRYSIFHPVNLVTALTAIPELLRWYGMGIVK
jgi:hypothetical protein